MIEPVEIFLKVKNAVLPTIEKQIIDSYEKDNFQSLSEKNMFGKLEIKFQIEVESNVWTIFIGVAQDLSWPDSLKFVYTDGDLGLQIEIIIEKEHICSEVLDIIDAEIMRLTEPID